MNSLTALSSFSYKLKALSPFKKKQPKAKVYEYGPKTEKKGSEKGTEKTNPRRSPGSTPKKKRSKGNDGGCLQSISNFFGSIGTFFSGADKEPRKEGETANVARSPGHENAPTTPTKVSQQPNYDVEAGEDETDDQEDAKLLQEEEEKKDTSTQETKGTTSSMQAGWNISNLIQGKLIKSGKTMKVH